MKAGSNFSAGVCGDESGLIGQNHINTCKNAVGQARGVGDWDGDGLTGEVSVMTPPGSIPPGQLSLHNTVKSLWCVCSHGGCRETLGSVAHKCLQTVLGF